MGKRRSNTQAGLQLFERLVPKAVKQTSFLNWFPGVIIFEIYEPFCENNSFTKINTRELYQQRGNWRKEDTYLLLSQVIAPNK